MSYYKIALIVLGLVFVIAVIIFMQFILSPVEEIAGKPSSTEFKIEREFTELSAAKLIELGGGENDTLEDFSYLDAELIMEGLANKYDLSLHEVKEIIEKVRNYNS